jgi:uncharacterized repeat protein (TIGR01451 family)
MTARGWTLAVAASAVAALIAPGPALAASDLSITKTDSADPVSVGSALTYTLTLANAGPDAATAVTVEDRVPNRVDFVSALPSQGACTNAARKITCELGALASGASAAVTIDVTTRKSGEISNTATVTSAEADSNAENNSATETTVVVDEYVTPRRCAGETPTIVGTKAGDTLVGTAERDVITGLGGNDTIKGLKGNDVICASGGNDTIKGHGGSDLLRGGTGDDSARGGGGEDLVKGVGGKDLLRGGTGDDLLRGGGGKDLLKGGGGTDTLRGGAGRDSLRGGGGEDVCRGGTGHDSKRNC